MGDVNGDGFDDLAFIRQTLKAGSTTRYDVRVSIVYGRAHLRGS